jgi:hypothetical protein
MDTSISRIKSERVQHFIGTAGFAFLQKEAHVEGRRYGRFYQIELFDERP